MSASDSTARPHRRLSLTLPTTPNPSSSESATEAAPADASVPAAASSPQDTAPSATNATDTNAAAAPVATVRVMAYLTEDEARLLDDIWFSLRREPSRPSKSDILRAALAVAAADRDHLSSALSEQQHSTLSRQRGSKSRLKSSG